MSALKTALLWLAALALAAWILMRLRQKDRIVLRGRFSPALIRMVAILIVAFGWRPAEAFPPPPEQCTTLPPSEVPPPAPALLTPARVALTVSENDLDSFSTRSPEQSAVSAFTSARTVPGINLPITLAQAERFARLGDARTKTIAEVGEPVFRPWMSKAGPPAGRGWERNIEQFLEVMRKKLPDANAGTWETEAVLDVIALSEGTLVRENVASAIMPGFNVRFRRFDLLRAGQKPLRVKHATLGELVIPAGKTIASWEVPGLLDAKARAHVAALVDKTHACDRAAASQLELILPAAHEALRAALAAPPEANPRPGRPLLSLLVALYDE